jgi:hypothetical protein
MGVADGLRLQPQPSCRRGHWEERDFDCCFPFDERGEFINGHCTVGLLGTASRPASKRKAMHDSGSKRQCFRRADKRRRENYFCELSQSLR